MLIFTFSNVVLVEFGAVPSNKCLPLFNNLSPALQLDCSRRVAIMKTVQNVSLDTGFTLMKPEAVMTAVEQEQSHKITI